MTASARDRTLQRMKRLLAFTAAVGATACGHDHGYAVVDPMPPPPRCPGVAQTITASVAWRQDEVGLADGTKAKRWRIVVTLSAPTMAGARIVPPTPGTAIEPPPSSDPSQPIYEPTPAGGVVVTFDGEDAKDHGWGQIECECGGARGVIAIYVEVPPTLGGPELPTVKLSDG
jgi:hypothetical protein